MSVIVANQSKHVRVQLPTSAISVALPASADAAPRLLGAKHRAEID